MEKRFLAIGIVTVLSASSFVILSLGYLFFGWGGQYRYELFYFPPPVTYTLNSLTTTGMILSIVLPVAAFSALLLSPEIIRIVSSRGSTGSHQTRADRMASISSKAYQTETVVSNLGGHDPADSDQAFQATLKDDRLRYLRSYPPGVQLAWLGRCSMNLTIEPKKKTRPETCDAS